MAVKGFNLKHAHTHTHTHTEEQQVSPPPLNSPPARMVSSGAHTHTCTLTAAWVAPAWNARVHKHTRTSHNARLQVDPDPCATCSRGPLWPCTHPHVPLGVPFRRLRRRLHLLPVPHSLVWLERRVVAPGPGQLQVRGCYVGCVCAGGAPCVQVRNVRGWRVSVCTWLTCGRVRDAAWCAMLHGWCVSVADMWAHACVCVRRRACVLLHLHPCMYPFVVGRHAHFYVSRQSWVKVNAQLKPFLWPYGHMHRSNRSYGPMDTCTAQILPVAL